MAVKEKATKAEVNYREGTVRRHCGLCTKFIRPHGCKGVAGKINAGDVCDRFVRKTRQQALYEED